MPKYVHFLQVILKNLKNFAGWLKVKDAPMRTTLLPLLKKMVVESLFRLQPMVNQEPPDIADWWDFTPLQRTIWDMALAERREQPQPKINQK